MKISIVLPVVLSIVLIIFGFWKFSKVKKMKSHYQSLEKTYTKYGDVNQKKIDQLYHELKKNTHTHSKDPYSIGIKLRIILLSHNMMIIRYRIIKEPLSYSLEFQIQGNISDILSCITELSEKNYHFTDFILTDLGQGESQIVFKTLI